MEFHDYFAEWEHGPIIVYSQSLLSLSAFIRQVISSSKTSTEPKHVLWVKILNENHHINMVAGNCLWIALDRPEKGWRKKREVKPKVRIDWQQSEVWDIMAMDQAKIHSLWSGVFQFIVNIFLSSKELIPNFNNLEKGSLIMNIVITAKRSMLIWYAWECQKTKSMSRFPKNSHSLSGPELCKIVLCHSFPSQTRSLLELNLGPFIFTMKNINSADGWMSVVDFSFFFSGGK